MIKALASGTHEERACALRDDVTVAVSIHEGGHVVMGRRHNLRFPVLLPALTKRMNFIDIAEYAGATIKMRDLNPNSTADVLFGGYCAELAFYDEQMLQSNTPIFVNASRAANDLRAFVKIFGLNRAIATALDRQLSCGGQSAEDTVKALFQRYGMQTYKAMRLHRGDLIDIAQELFDFWKANKFQRCIWR